MSHSGRQQCALACPWLQLLSILRYWVNLDFVEGLLYPNIFWESAWCSYILESSSQGGLIVNVHDGAIGTERQLSEFVLADEDK